MHSVLHKTLHTTCLKITHRVLILATGRSRGHTKDWIVTLENGPSPSQHLRAQYVCTQCKNFPRVIAIRSQRRMVLQGRARAAPRREYLRDTGGGVSSQGVQLPLKSLSQEYCGGAGGRGHNESLRELHHILRWGRLSEMCLRCGPLNWTPRKCYGPFKPKQELIHRKHCACTSPSVAPQRQMALFLRELND